MVEVVVSDEGSVVMVLGDGGDGGNGFRGDGGDGAGGGGDAGAYLANGST